MQLEVNGTRLWFDTDGSALVPEGAGHFRESARAIPTVVPAPAAYRQEADIGGHRVLGTHRGVGSVDLSHGDQAVAW